MLSKASRRVLALGGGRDWLGVIGRVMKQQENVAGLVSSCSSRRSIVTGNAPPRIHTTATQESAAVPLAVDSVIRNLGQVLKEAEGSSKAWLATATRELMARAKAEEAPAVTEGMEKYQEYLSSLSDGRMLSDELRKGLDGCVGLSWEKYQYQPWRQLLERLFPDMFGYEISLEKVLKKTMQFSDGDIVKVEDWFLVVRHGAHVRLLALGFDATFPNNLERSFAKLMRRVEPMAVRVMQSKQAGETVPWVAFCGQDFCWGEVRFASSSPERLGGIAHVQRDAGEPTLFQLAQHVHSLSASQP